MIRAQIKLLMLIKTRKFQIEISVYKGGINNPNENSLPELLAIKYKYPPGR
jgi:hypothetical protein